MLPYWDLKGKILTLHPLSVVRRYAVLRIHPKIPSLGLSV